MYYQFLSCLIFICDNTYFFLLISFLAYSWTLKIEEGHSTKTSPTWSYIPEGSYLTFYVFS
jgi:hypothetical protein